MPSRDFGGFEESAARSNLLPHTPEAELPLIEDDGVRVRLVLPEKEKIVRYP